MSDLDSVIINLKACLVSIKGGIPLSQLENDYFKLNGEHIPFRNLGFSSLEALLNSSGKFTIQNRGGDKVVQALITKKTQHLTDLIKKQKSKPPKKKIFIGNKNVSRKFNTSSCYNNRPNNYSRQGNNASNFRPLRNNSRSESIPNYTNTHKTFGSYNNIRHNQYNSYQQKIFDQRSYNKPQTLINYNSKNTNNYGNYQSNSDVGLSKSKDMNPSNINGKSYTKLEQKLPLTSSCSSLESTYSSSSASYTYKPTSINSLDKFQIGNIVNNTVTQIVNRNYRDKIPKNIYNQEEKKELTQPHVIMTKFSPTQNMPMKPSTAQSRLQKYPKKCDEPLFMNNIKEKLQTEELEKLSDKITGIEVDPYNEVIDDKDYIGELESYLKNLNSLEPYYDCMVKKEKSGKRIKHSHICTIKVNEKNVSSSFPVECSTVDYAKQVAAKHALIVLKKQYGENVIYPITNDINTMASHIKEFLKSGYEGTGLMDDVLERMYREQYQENLPDNWIQLLEVFSYFSFDKPVADKVIIYLKKDDDNESNDNINEGLETPIEELIIVPGTPSLLTDYEEKSVLVSANYGSTSVWIRFVAQSADVNFIQMNEKFNDTMNTTDISVAENLNEGEYYAVLYNSSWHRVQITSPKEEDSNTVTCFMVDTGEQLNIDVDQICYLEPVFMKTKTQAIECMLTQLDNFGQFDGLKELLDEMILNKTFFLVPDSLEDGYARITLYEKGEDSNRLNVNDMIIERFLEKTIAKLPSFEENAVVDGAVSSVVESGHLYLQLNFDVVSSLEEILPNDEYLLPEFFLKSKDDVLKDQVYLIKYEADNIWSRVQVIEIINDTQAKIIYIDYGNIANCEISKLVNLDMFDPLMAKIPPQAIKVSMNLLPPSIMTPDIAKKIYEIIGGDKVLVNLINAPLNDVPCIQLYKTQPDTPDIPLCINVQLAQSLKKQ